MLVKLAVLCRGHRLQKKGVQRTSLNQPPTRCLSVVWLRGGFGRGAGASSDGFLHHMDWLEHVYTKVGPSGVPPPVARALSQNSSLAPVWHCLSGWGITPEALA